MTSCSNRLLGYRGQYTWSIARLCDLPHETPCATEIYTVLVYGFHSSFDGGNIFRHSKLEIASAILDLNKWKLLTNTSAAVCSRPMGLVTFNTQFNTNRHKFLYHIQIFYITNLICLFKKNIFFISVITQFFYTFPMYNNYLTSSWDKMMNGSILYDILFYYVKIK